MTLTVTGLLLKMKLGRRRKVNILIIRRRVEIMDRPQEGNTMIIQKVNIHLKAKAPLAWKANRHHRHLRKEISMVEIMVRFLKANRLRVGIMEHRRRLRRRNRNCNRIRHLVKKRACLLTCPFFR